MHLPAALSPDAVLFRQQQTIALQDLVHIKLIETRDHILGALDRHISEYADKQFARQGIEVVYNSRVRRQPGWTCALADHAAGSILCTHHWRHG